ncbi:hypothetical protein [Thetidibacter halocola]|uniref:hypothetical protein n=1 Tax=Thetidibacter halocola TaxID=2827239 RepID=UPI002013AAAA|nr:hypothetical protein [Thetidibacter halocola]
MTGTFRFDSGIVSDAKPFAWGVDRQQAVKDVENQKNAAFFWHLVVFMGPRMGRGDGS